MTHKTYPARLADDRLIWESEAPPEATSAEGVRVLVEVIESEVSNEERGRRMKEALEKLAAIGGFSEIADPVAWQREIRKDRPLRAPLSVDDTTVQRRLSALRTLAAMGAFKDIDDPVAWQREERRDRPLPGREADQ